MSPKALIAGTAIALTTASTALAGPAISTRWQDVDISQDECLLRAEDSIKASGFGQIERTDQSRYGTRGDYTAAIRCITSNKIVVFITSGPSRNRVGEGTEALYKNF